MYFVEVTGVMTATENQETRKPKFDPELVVATTKDSLHISKSNNHHAKAPSYQTTQGTV
jgi:hypothetical protein